jgi:recombination associated protein RdgC
MLIPGKHAGLDGRGGVGAVGEFGRVGGVGRGGQKIGEAGKQRGGLSGRSYGGGSFPILFGGMRPAGARTPGGLTGRCALLILPRLMPVLRGAVTFSRFLVEPAEDAPADLKRWIVKALKARAFEPIDRKSEEERASGFVELENPEGTDFSSGSVSYAEYTLFAYRVDTLKVPGPVLRAELNKWAAAFEKEKGRPPGRSEKAEGRASLRQMLRNRATPSTKVHDLSWNVEARQLQVWAASRTAVEEVMNAVETTFKVKLLPLVPAAMAERSGLAEASLGPTAELLGVELSAEVNHGEA